MDAPLDFEVLRARKLREAEALGEVDVRNVTPSVRDFAYYVGTNRREVTVVPVLMRREPGGAPIPERLDFAALVPEAEEAGALAFAVCTDAVLHGGSEQDLALVARLSGVPVLRVDFPVRESQLYRSRLLGADAALLHASLLDEPEIARLLAVGRHMHMECVVEAADLAGIDRAVAAGARIVSIDARGAGAREAADADADAGGPGDARASIDDLLASVPASTILLVRGGRATVEEIAALRGKVDAVLVGAPFLAAPDPARFLSGLIES